MTMAMTTDVWRREGEPYGSRSTTTDLEGASTAGRSIFEVLREILPRYDLEAVAERAEALGLLLKMDREAASREESMPSPPDTAEEQAERTAISEALAPGQLESMAGHDDQPAE
jgi:hypothetical protein